MRTSPTRTYVRSMDRQYELESLRRSIAMLRVGAPALDREAAIVLVRELQSLCLDVELIKKPKEPLVPVAVE